MPRARHQDVVQSATRESGAEVPEREVDAPPPVKDIGTLLRTLATAPEGVRGRQLAGLQSGVGNAALAGAIAAHERATAPPRSGPRSGSTTMQVPIHTVIQQGPTTGQASGESPLAGVFRDSAKGAEHGHTAVQAAAAAGVPADAATAKAVDGEAAPPPKAGAKADAAQAGEAAPEKGPEQQEQEISLPDIKLTGVEHFALCDALWTWMSYSGTVVHGGAAAPAADEFGVTVPGNIVLANIKIRHGLGQFLVTATLNQQVDWQVRAGLGPNGEVSIGSALDPAITAANYATVASDLTPDMSDLGGRPPRTQFWAQDLTERHENYHADDCVNRGPAALRVATAWLRTQQAPDVPGVTLLLNQVPGRAFTALIAAMAFPAREERAYGDGALAYSMRANAIKALGAVGWY